MTDLGIGGCLDNYLLGGALGGGVIFFWDGTLTIGVYLWILVLGSYISCTLWFYYLGSYFIRES